MLFKGGRKLLPIFHFSDVLYLYISSFIGGYWGPGENGVLKFKPDLLKRFALLKDHIGLFFSSDNINLPNDVYDLLLASSVSLKSI